MAQWKQDILKINGIPSNFNFSDFNYYMLHLNGNTECVKRVVILLLILSMKELYPFIGRLYPFGGRQPNHYY